MPENISYASFTDYCIVTYPSTEDTDDWEAALVAQHMPPTDTTDSDSESDSEGTPTSPAKPKLSRINIQAMLEELTHYAHTEDESFLTHAID